MKYFLTTILFTLSLLTTQAQTFSQEVWYDGKVVLDTEDTLVGNVRFDLADNLLQLETAGGLKAYTSRNVIAFEINDEVNKMIRKYYSLPYGIASNYKVPVFFELLTQGDLTLLCREKLVTETAPIYGYNPYGYGYGMGRPNYYGTRNRIAFDFYFGYPNGNIKSFLGNKKDFFYLVKDHQQDIKEFVREQKLRYNDRNDLTKIVSYYNYLKGK